MSTTTSPSLPAIAPPATAGGSEDFRLDVRIVERGPVASVLLGDTDDGCDTVRGSDC